MEVSFILSMYIQSKCPIFLFVLTVTYSLKMDILYMKQKTLFFDIFSFSNIRIFRDALNKCNEEVN
jgi:hypothetical protein